MKIRNIVLHWFSFKNKPFCPETAARCFNSGDGSSSLFTNLQRNALSEFRSMNSPTAVIQKRRNMRQTESLIILMINIYNRN
ncbi:hypothetical protein Pint_03625 [Pistacia integerrima]|uniref:Uncharacterized protein n=1 Tax=Pistacia integerrima TaxID=434235 RepID=A0ACC0ZA71_9ROSI|nr:hypothetical protein Pint_03625 [Pistacia integerrima]